MKTKSSIRFLNRIAHFDADIELAHIISLAAKNGLLNSKTNKYIFEYITPEQHPRLAARANSSTSRVAVANHLKSILYEAFIKNIYEDLTQYLLEILKAAANNGLDPNRMIGEHKVTFEANDILNAGSWAKVVDLLSTSVFRKLEDKRNTKGLIQSINDKLNLKVSKQKIDDALPYLEIRHLLVHNDGKADKKFCDTFPSFGASIGKQVKLEHKQIEQARKTICSLVDEFDKKIVFDFIVARSELQP